jgi:capsular exopolysaccharide synthesis family protein
LDLRDYFRILVKRWRLLLIPTLLCVAAGVGTTVAATPIYQASAQLFISVQAGTDVTSLAQGNSFSQGRVPSYAEIVTSPSVTRAVVDQLKLDITPEQLAGQITAEVPPSTVLINLSVTDTQAKRAADIANAVAKRFATVVEELERPVGTGRTPVKLSVTQPARSPDSPVAPKPAQNISLAFLLGLSLGVGLAVLRESLDTSVKSTDDLARAAGVPALGAIVFDRQAAKNVVVTNGDPHSPRAEAFRQLRTNLQFVDVDRQPELIVITSPVPNEGKTTTAVNLAASLAEVDISVCLVDGDLRRPSVADALGLVRDAGLTSVLIGQARLEDVLQSAGPNFSVLTSGPVPPNPSELLASAQMGMMLRDLASRFDLVIVDTPPLLPVTDGAVLASQVDGALLVVRAGKTSRDQVARAAEALRKVGARTLGAVLNMAPSKGPSAYYYSYSYSYRPDVSRGAPRHRSGERAKGDAMSTVGAHNGSSGDSASSEG